MYNTRFYEKMSLKNLKPKENIHPQMHELQFLKTLLFSSALLKL